MAFLDGLERGYLEKRIGGSAAVRAVLDLGLLGQVVGRVDGRVHFGGGQEGCQVGRVRRDHDEGEEPPDAGHCPSRNGPFVSCNSSCHDL